MYISLGFYRTLVGICGQLHKLISWCTFVQKKVHVYWIYDDFHHIGIEIKLLGLHLHNHTSCIQKLVSVLFCSIQLLCKDPNVKTYTLIKRLSITKKMARSIIEMYSAHISGGLKGKWTGPMDPTN